ncbi:DNA-binding transcriptional regulator, MurR/RpiR family, contains HTH and SIS domains [Nonomuraea solani]|uniref:DNA-binding transcriptional regulator, MurR/RpiR family, contains HTH and SIS domains n=1 Tax=Nonomuraea solani TaxID=1144553 RepID=A0A1H6EVH7_9ACTN|nr:MurR/RpiR family transcriptional regulator [Nonomuraea solani]SEH01091.1 DNA-binding transcriptional regulator, MurR/RpiR family, contains HTH and SIS domains [Nonomuraea solani]
MEQNSLAATVRAKLLGLHDAEARVAQVVLDQGARLVHLSVSDVAGLAGTSASTVVRSCRRLGFGGYQELKIAAARETPPEPRDELDPLTATVRAAREALGGLETTLSRADLGAAAEAINEAGRVLMAATGLSGAVAVDAAYRLRALGLPVDLPPDPLTAHLAAELLPERSVCLAISHSGATRSTVETARRARAAGARVVAITSYTSSPLVEESTWALVGGGQDLVLGMEAVAGRLAHLTIVDALSMILLGLGGGRAERAVSASADVTADHSY